MEIEIDAMQFLESLCGDLLDRLGIEFNPVGEYSSRLELDVPNWFYIVESIQKICQAIHTLNSPHLKDVIDYVREYDNCHIYMDLLCRRLFEVSFTWSNFRIYLAHFVLLHILATRNGEVLLADNFFITTEAHIRLYLQDEVRHLGGWGRFFGNCVRSAMKLNPRDIRENELMPPHLMDKIGTYHVLSASKMALDTLTRGR